MKRRNFTKASLGMILTGGLTSSAGFMYDLLKLQDIIIGHNDHRYKIDLFWGALDANQFPVNDCHEMVQDSLGRIVLLTNHTKNNVIIYDKSGKLLEVWGTEYPGAHGLTIHSEGGQDFLYICDNNRHEVIKTTMKGQVAQIFKWPHELSQYQKADQYIPTETAIAPNGDVYVADGYGSQYIIHYNSSGKIQNVFGGRGDTDASFDNAHGICLDNRPGRAPTLLITARQQNKLKRFSLSGELLDIIQLPGAYICRPVVHGNEIYLATLISRLPWNSESGFITIIDKNDRVVSVPGGSSPNYQGQKLDPLHQTIKVFKHPHDVCVDDDENLYVAQWNSGRSYPIKLVRV